MKKLYAPFALFFRLYVAELDFLYDITEDSFCIEKIESYIKACMFMNLFNLYKIKLMLKFSCQILKKLTKKPI